jgi:hypothetical protein
MAVAKHLNVYPDLDARYSPYDLIYNGFRINVKSTIADHHDLLIPDYQQSRSDFYILVTGKVPVLNIRGVATSEMIYNDQNLIDLGKGVCISIEAESIDPILGLVKCLDLIKNELSQCSSIRSAKVILG